MTDLRSARQLLNRGSTGPGLPDSCCRHCMPPHDAGSAGCICDAEKPGDALWSRGQRVQARPSAIAVLSDGGQVAGGGLHAQATCGLPHTPFRHSTS